MGGIISRKSKAGTDYSKLKIDILKAEDYDIGKYLAEGGSGKIHVATRKSDGMLVVSEVFGYNYNYSDPAIAYIHTCMYALLTAMY